MRALISYPSAWLGTLLLFGAIVGAALTRWLGDQIVVGGVDVQAQGEAVIVEVAYVRRSDLSRQAVRVHFR